MNTAKSIFGQALAIDGAEERAAYLEQACGGDAALRAEVESLLFALEGAREFLKQPAIGHTVGTVAYEPISEEAGTVIGPYKLLQEIGEGGFGVVFMAEQQEPIRRMVALKIIKPGMDTAQVIARFESERQALALMDHPNIAKVLDANATESGRPYFVMELVKGVPITEFCDKNHMPAEDRLKLFIDVCHAIQHAHHKGVIHRDIKPSNVMVTLHDGVPVVKVIDFGVAKATVQKLTEKTLFTAYGQMVGTPVYMSPEQAEMSGLDIDTRSDVYSLGVLLYELLTGTTPLTSKRLREAGYAEMQRLIREEEAPRPSKRLSSLGDSATVMAGNRGLDLNRLVQLLSGDLDWVVMKALNKDRDRRYGTPGNFAEDIERYLRREAILARSPSSVYKLRKFAQRNRAAMLTTGAVAVALILGTAVAIWQAIRATDAQRQASIDAVVARNAEAIADEARKAEAGERVRAQKQKVITQAVKEFLESDLLAQADPFEGVRRGDIPDPDLKLTAAIDRAAKNISRRFAGQPLVEASVRVTIGGIYWRRLLFPEAQSQLERACELCRGELSRSQVGAVDKLVLSGCADAFFDLAILFMNRGQIPDAVALLRKAEADIGPVVGGDLDAHALADAFASMRKALEANDWPNAGAIGMDTQKRFRGLGPTEPAKAPNAAEQAAVAEQGREWEWRKKEITKALKFMGEHKYSEAEHVLEKMGDHYRRNGDFEMEASLVLPWLVEVYLLQGKIPLARAAADTAVAWFKKSLGEKYPQAASSFLGRVLLAEKKYEQAEAWIRIELAHYATQAPDHHRHFDCMNRLGACLAGQKKYAAAEPLLMTGYEGLRDRATRFPSYDRRLLPEAIERLVHLYDDWGKKNEAEKWRKELEAVRKSAEKATKPY